MRYLTCHLKAKKLNVLQYAAKKGATGLLDEILDTPYVFKDPVTELFDVTYLIPDTVPDPTDDSRKPLSCLELIVNSKNIDQAEDVLSIYPFNDLVANYWILCRRVYNALLCAHIIFMGLFTVFCMPTTALSALVSTRTPKGRRPAVATRRKDRLPRRPRAITTTGWTLQVYGLFLIWPAIICFMELFTGLEFCYRSYINLMKSERKHKSKQPAHAEKQEWWRAICPGCSPRDAFSCSASSTSRTCRRWLSVLRRLPGTQYQLRILFTV